MNVSTRTVLNPAVEKKYMSAVIAGLSYATLLVQLLLLIGLAVFIGRKAGFDLSNRYLEQAEELLYQWYRETAFLVATVATSGSLYMSQILGWEPCLMCWYQRILIYPMVVLLGVAIVLRKDDVSDYVMPLAMIGIPIAAYHYMIQRLDQFQDAGCSVLSVSCETTYTFYFGYISIPMMALTAMIAILVLVWRFSSTES